MRLVYGKAREKLSRRRFLYGAGKAIALPLLHSAAGISGAAANTQAPERFIGFFVAQGLPEEVTINGLDFHEHNVEPFAALKPFAEKLSMVRGVDVLTEGPGKTEHTVGCSSFLCGADYESVESKGSVTLDWKIKTALGHDTILPTLNTGIWGADDAEERARIVHSWRGVKQPNEPIPDTLQLFEYLFGTAPGDGSPLKQIKYRRSVLDLVVEDYKKVVSESSGFSSDVKNLISGHLETVRELELRIAAQAEQQQNCVPPEKPESISGNGRFPPNTSNWPRIWDIVADLSVLAYRCDLVRTGTMMVDSGGDAWSYNSVHGFTGDVHGTMHAWRGERDYKIALDIWRWFYAKVGDFLGRLDAPDYTDADGGTLLDNTTVLVGTELGDPVHKLENLTYFIAGAKKRFKPGVHTLTDVTDVDLYNTVLASFGIDEQIGSQKNATGLLTSILS